MKICFKSIVVGAVVAALGMATVFAATGIKSASFNSNKVIFNGQELNLQGQQLISVVLDGEQNASNYMPVQGVLVAMGYDVSWDAEKSAVIINSKNTSKLAKVVKDNPQAPFTKAPTAEDLDGYWTGKTLDGTDVQYSFGDDGHVREFITHNGFPSEMLGKYSLSGNSIEITYNFKMLEGHKISYHSQEPLIFSETIGISDDGKQITLSDTDADSGKSHTMLLTRAAEPLELKGTHFPTMHELNGTWVTEQDGEQATYTFANGKVTFVLVDTDSKETITFKGTYSLDNSVDQKHLHILFNSVKNLSDEIAAHIAKEPVCFDYFAGVKANTLILTNGNVPVSFTKK